MKTFAITLIAVLLAACSSMGPSSSPHFNYEKAQKKDLYKGGSR